MIVTSISYINKSRIRVSLDNHESFILYKSELLRYKINEGEVLDNYDEILHDTLIPRAKKRALYLIAKMDRSRADVIAKLKEGGYPDVAVDEAVSYLESYGYIDDLKYAYMYVRSYRYNRSYNRIKQDMYKKGIDRDLINKALSDEYNVDEVDIINMYINKRHFDKANSSKADRDKMYRFLLSKGFELDTIRLALDN